MSKELIVVDDGSTDETRDVLGQVQRQYPEPQLRVWKQPRNRGKGAALRKGTGLATGDYVIIRTPTSSMSLRSMQYASSLLGVGKLQIEFSVMR